MEKVKIKLNGGLVPTKGSGEAAAYDLYCPCNYELKRGRQVIPLGFSMELPHGKAAIIQPRSGFSAKGMLVQALVRKSWFLFLGIFSREQRVDADVLIGLVDEDYRDEVGVLVSSRYHSFFRKAVIPSGTRIAQMRIVDVPETVISEVSNLDMSNDRGGGFGHSGVK